MKLKKINATLSLLAIVFLIHIEELMEWEKMLRKAWNVLAV